MALDQEDMLRRIRRAFADVRRGEGISLHEAVAIDDHASPAQREAARRLDTDRHWSEVPDAHIASHASVFSFLDLRGHVYYAPAYMSWMVRHGHTTESNSVEAAENAFHPWGKWEDGRRHLPDEMFSAAQCACIAQYLQYVYEVIDERWCFSTAKEYLDAYWHRYLPA
ncbi:DUF6714 family protein [Ideonella sp.]|uniref:DUF6714 family protein n=1 Tax=Ideonella sp. TaxID=1929293 RepID=UPI0035B45701